jgi:hypothetical protein
MGFKTPGSTWHNPQNRYTIWNSVICTTLRTTFHTSSSMDHSIYPFNIFSWYDLTSYDATDGDHDNINAKPCTISATLLKSLSRECFRWSTSWSCQASLTYKILQQWHQCMTKKASLSPHMSFQVQRPSNQTEWIYPCWSLLRLTIS